MLLDLLAVILLIALIGCLYILKHTFEEKPPVFDKELMSNLRFVDDDVNHAEEMVFERTLNSSENDDKVDDIAAKESVISINLGLAEEMIHLEDHEGALYFISKIKDLSEMTETEKKTYEEIKEKLA